MDTYLVGRGLNINEISPYGVISNNRWDDETNIVNLDRPIHGDRWNVIPTRYEGLLYLEPRVVGAEAREAREVRDERPRIGTVPAGIGPTRFDPLMALHLDIPGLTPEQENEGEEEEPEGEEPEGEDEENREENEEDMDNDTMQRLERLFRDTQLREVHVEGISSPACFWDGENQESFLQITKEVVGPHFRNICLIVPNGWPYGEEDVVNSLRILVWSSPSNTGKKSDPPEKVLGHKVDCRDFMFPPSEDSKNVKILLDGTPMLEFVAPNRLYFLWDAVHVCTDDSKALYRKSLEAFLEQVGLEKLKKMQDDFEIYRKDAEQRKTASFLSLSMTRELEKSRTEIEALRAKISETQTNLTLYIRDHDRKMAILQTGLSKEAVEERVNLMLRDIRKIKMVKGITIVDNDLVVMTEMIHVIDPRTKRTHQIGEFDIKLNVDAGKMPLMLNKTMQIASYDNRPMQAPHVFPDGRPCLGDMVQSLPEVQARFDYVTLATLCIMYLQSVNTSDPAGRYIHRWPRLEEDGKYSEWGARPVEERKVGGVS